MVTTPPKRPVPWNPVSPLKATYVANIYTWRTVSG